jgi:hypothetical protein
VMKLVEQGLGGNGQERRYASDALSFRPRS